MAEFYIALFKIRRTIPTFGYRDNCYKMQLLLLLYLIIIIFQVKRLQKYFKFITFASKVVLKV